MRRWRVPEQVRPRQSGVHLVLGSGRHGRHARPLVEAWVALALAGGHVVHWLDGACRLDPGRLMDPLRRLGAGPRSLRALRVARGFTAHQFAAMAARLPQEVEESGAALVVFDAPATMLDDPEIGAREGRDLMRHLCSDMQHLVDHTGIVALVICGEGPEANARWRIQRLRDVSASVLEVRHAPGEPAQLRKDGGAWWTLSMASSFRSDGNRQTTLTGWAPQGLKAPAKGP